MMLKNLITIIFILLLSFSVIAQSDIEYPVKVAVDNSTLFLFDENLKHYIRIEEGVIEFSERRWAKYQIMKDLETAFDQTLKKLMSNISAISDPGIQNALRSLANDIKDGSRELLIKFAFDNNAGGKYPGYYNYYMSRYYRIDSNGNNISNMTFDDMIKDQDVHGRTDNSSLIVIYNGIEDFSVIGITTTDPASGCIYEDVTWKLTNFIPPGWTNSGDKLYALESAIFHEFIHIALNEAVVGVVGDGA